MLKIDKLKNGLDVLKISQKETKAVKVLVLFKVGSRYEAESVNGVSHFIEHLMFKGTKKRPDTLTISKELDEVGANYNAFTSKEYTGYYIKIDHEKQELAFDMLSDMLFNSTFKQEEIDKERGVIIEEINMYEDNPLMHCGELLEELLFSEKHPLGRLISGPRKNIKKITRKQILNYRDNFYNSSNMLLAVGGRISKKTDNLIKKYFNNTSSKPKKQKFKKFKNYQTKPQVSLSFKETEQVQLGLGFPAFAAKHKDVPALELLDVIFGDNMSSRLFINIREKQGLCYFIRSSSDSYNDTGLFSIRAGLDKNRITDAIKAILKELHDILDNGVTKEELTKAKSYLKGKAALNLEGASSLVSFYATQKLSKNELKTPEEKIKEYEKVTEKDIARVAKKIIDFSKINLVLIGPYKNKSKFLKLLK